MKPRKKIVGLLILSAMFAGGIFVVWPNTIWFIASIFLGEWSAGQARFTLKSTADDRPIIIFEQRTIDYHRHPFLVITFSELVPSKPGKERKVWEIIQDKGPWLERLDSVTYGECLPDFKQTLAPEPLLDGHFYKVIGSELIHKVGRGHYELIPHQEYLHGVETGKYKDAKDIASPTRDFNGYSDKNGFEKSRK